MDESTYNQAYWLTYGVMPPTYKPMPTDELQVLLEKIANPQP
jgi:hypothetical protein